MTILEDLRTDGAIPALQNPAWTAAHPWLLHGTTLAPMDFRLFGDAPSGPVLENWLRLQEGLDVPRVVHARQVHGSEVAVHSGEPGWTGLNLLHGVDGHTTGDPGTLLTVSLADCVPVFVVAPRVRAVALLHAGWRGAAAGILSAGLRRMALSWGVSPGEVEVHLGPAICGACYEVGPEVHAALALPVPPGPEPVDVRAALHAQALSLGVPPGAVTRSSACTRCGPHPLHSHRGGSAGRQIAYLGVRVRP